MIARGRTKVPWIVASLVAVLAVALASSTATGASRQASDTVTITIWDWQGAGAPVGKAFEKLDKQFMNANPNLKIKRVHQPFNSYFTLLRTAVASKSGPDVFQNYASAAIFDYYDGLLPLTDYVTPKQRRNLFGWGNVSAGLNERSTPLAVPFGGQGELFYYNKDLFRKAGLDPNKPPKTWAQFLRVCEALKNAGIVPISGGFKDGYYAEWWFDNLASQFMTNAELRAFPSKPRWTHPAIKKGFELTLDLIERGYMTPNSEGLALFPDVLDAFKGGRAAILLALPSMAGSELRKPLGTKLGVFLPPIAPGAIHKKQRLLYAPAFGLSVAKWSKVPRDAYKLISFMTNASSQKYLFESVGQLPNSTAVTPKSSYPPLAQILRWITTVELFTGPDYTIRPSVEAVLDKAIPSIVVGQISIDKALQLTQAAQDKLPPIPKK